MIPYTLWFFFFHNWFGYETNWLFLIDLKWPVCYIHGMPSLINLFTSWYSQISLPLSPSHLFLRLNICRCSSMPNRHSSLCPATDLHKGLSHSLLFFWCSTTLIWNVLDCTEILLSAILYQLTAFLSLTMFSPCVQSSSFSYFIVSGSFSLWNRSSKLERTQTFGAPNITILFYVIS